MTVRAPVMLIRTDPSLQHSDPHSLLTVFRLVVTVVNKKNKYVG